MANEDMSALFPPEGTDAIAYFVEWNRSNFEWRIESVTALNEQRESDVITQREYEHRLAELDAEYARRGLIHYRTCNQFWGSQDTDKPQQTSGCVAQPTLFNMDVLEVENAANAI